MSEIVFILGAGASRDAGAPLMGNFLDVAETLWQSGRVPEAADDFRLVFKAYAQLDRVHAKSSVKLNNLEEVFAAFEMATLIEHLGGLGQREVSRLPAAMQQVILHTLEQTVGFSRHTGDTVPPQPYGVFVHLLGEISEKRSVSVITFNYDLCLDFACQYKNIPVDYCLGEDGRHGTLRLLKLHGSLNWGRCSKCRKTVAWPLRDCCQQPGTWSQSPVNSTRLLHVGSRLGHYHHCPGGTVSGPYIAPPTWNKGQYHRELASVWRTAAGELKEAEQVFVCGYSLPDTDHFFRYLHALGSVGPARLKRFAVINPASDMGVMERFEDLLGNAVRHRFKPLVMSFAQAMGPLQEEFIGPRARR